VADDRDGVIDHSPGAALDAVKNWERHRTTDGTCARLLKIAASNPKSAIEALHT